jgi:flagellar hook-basal body complex protein FliE
MSDPLGLIGNTHLIARDAPMAGGRAAPADGIGFKETLQQQIAEVNELQRDAKEAIEDLATGRRDDIESVMIATQKADTAFKMLLQVRNRMMDAYEEIKQLRV